MIFRDAGFHFTHEIRAHVRRLGVNTTAHTREERNGGGAKREARQHSENLIHASRRGGIEVAVIKEKQSGKPQHPKAHHAHAHYRAATESDVERGSQSRTGGVRGADVSFGGYFHADIAGERRARGADHEGKRDERARMLGLRQRQKHRHRNDKPR